MFRPLLPAFALAFVVMALPLGDAIAAVTPAAAPAASGAVATFDVATLPDAQLPENWSPVKELDGKKCRAISAGKNGAVRMKAWWKAGALRPAEGDLFTLEVTYQDVVPSPVQVYAWAAVGWNFRQSPMHRFGGLNDGKWKTAQIPLPWDMIARMIDAFDGTFNHPDFTQVSFDAPAELPISTLVVRKATSDDEKRFYAECRELIARDQAGARAKTPTAAVANPPKLDGRLVAYPSDPWCRVFQYNPVPTDQVGKAVKVRMCENEIEPAAFAVYANGGPLTGVEYEVTALKDASGKELKVTVDRRTAEYSLTDGNWVPIRLWPAYAADVEVNRNQWCFIDLETRRGEAKPGKYSGKILITAKEGKAELPLEVEVLPVDLMTIDEAGITALGCYDKMPPLHDVEFERRYGYAGCLLWGPFNFPTVYRDGKVQIDFTGVDDWMKGLKKRGFTSAVWYQGGDAAGSPNTLTSLIRLAALIGMHGGAYENAQNGKPFVLPEVRKVYVEWMREISTHAVANGWPELLPTPHDEPMKYLFKGDWIKGCYQDACAALHEADPKLRVYGCIHMVQGGNAWNVLVNDIDVYNTNAVWEDAKLGDKVRGANQESLAKGGKGKQFWQYITGYFAGSPKSLRYMFGFYFGSFGSTGCTSWAYNWDDKWDMSGKGDAPGITAWPTAWQTIPSPWFEGQRDGLDDRRLIATYQKKFAKDAAAMDVLNKILAEAQASRGAYGVPGVGPGYVDAADLSAKLIGWRETLIKKLIDGK